MRSATRASRPDDSLTARLARRTARLARRTARLARGTAVVGILLLVTLTLTWVAVVAGLSAKTVDGASAFSYPLVFLPFVSSAFVPTDTMPAPVRWFAQRQPATSIVDSLRALLAGRTVGPELWVALAWCVGVLAVAATLAMWQYRRRTG